MEQEITMQYHYNYKTLARIQTSKDRSTIKRYVWGLILFFVLLVIFAFTYHGQVRAVRFESMNFEPSSTTVTTRALVPLEHAQRVSVVYDKAWDFVRGYGGKIDKQYFDLLYSECSDERIREVIAISVAETGMGKAGGHSTNFWGYTKREPDKATMARMVCSGLKSTYKNIGSSAGLVALYTGNDHSDTWVKNFNYAMERMK